MPTADWTNEVFPGQAVSYNEPNLTYNQTAPYQGAGVPRYNTIGITTSWTNENK